MCFWESYWYACVPWRILRRFVQVYLPSQQTWTSSSSGMIFTAKADRERRERLATSCKGGHPFMSCTALFPFFLVQTRVPAKLGRIGGGWIYRRMGTGRVPSLVYMGIIYMFWVIWSVFIFTSKFINYVRNSQPEVVSFNDSFCL